MKKLGFGLMRLPLLNPDDNASVDLKAFEKMADTFLEKGFTYFDTAWIYHKKKGEEFFREAVAKRHDRSEYTITTKLHPLTFGTIEEVEKIFRTQLENLGVSYFDYYLLHDVNEMFYKKFTDIGCWKWLSDMKTKGLVKQMGFSFHDRADVLDRILTEHPEVDFVQLQINYLDWDSPIQSHENYDTAVKHGKKVIVMEPVKGGVLMNIPEAALELQKNVHPDWSAAEWAIKFAASLPDVMMVLSGMSNQEQMEDNLSFMQDFVPLTEEEKEVLKKCVGIINNNVAIPCTGCSYCTESCPIGMPIPKYFSLYNMDHKELSTMGWTSQKALYDCYVTNFPKAGDCLQCGACEGSCPQGLKIIDIMQEVSAYFDKERE